MICTGGEPWTEKPWKWLFQVIGKSKVPIMNSAGGTEVSGSICIVVYIVLLRSDLLMLLFPE